MKRYSENLSKGNIENIITLRNMCLEPALRDLFHNTVRDIKLILFEDITHSTCNQKASFVLAIRFENVIDFVFSENVLEETNEKVVKDIESYGIKIEDILNERMFNYIFYELHKSIAWHRPNFKRTKPPTYLSEKAQSNVR